MMAIELYVLPNTTGQMVAWHPQESRWEIFPTVANGYARRRDWSPAPALAKRILELHNGIEQIYRARLSEILGTRRWLGIPA